MKNLSLALLIALFSFPAIAQEEGTPVPAAPEAAAAEASNTAIPDSRLKLAREMHDIWPIRTRMETAIEAVSESFAPERKAEIKAALRKAVQFDQLEEASIRAMAQTFNEAELTEMIKFYGSDIGRSVSAKTGDYEMALRPLMTQMMDKAMLDLRTGQQQQ